MVHFIVKRERLNVIINSGIISLYVRSIYSLHFSHASIHSSSNVSFWSLPGALRRGRADLNCSYVYSVSGWVTTVPDIALIKGRFPPHQVPNFWFFEKLQQNYIAIYFNKITSVGQRSICVLY